MSSSVVTEKDSLLLRIFIVVRTAIAAFLFISGSLIIVGTQLIGKFLFDANYIYKQYFINTSKLHFLRLMTFLVSMIHANDISITYDTSKLVSSSSSPSTVFTVDDQHNIHSKLSPNSIVISNHQVYTDWLYLWFLGYTSNLSQNIFIVLKDMSNIPVLGYGMKNYNFLFLSRKWETDKVIISKQLDLIDSDAMGTNKQLQQLGKPKTILPYYLIIFPEGTVPSIRTKKKSLEYTQFKNLPPLKHILLPRVRGLLLVLRKLHESVEVLYDITTGCGDLAAGEIGEDKFSLKNHFIKGNGPPIIYHYIKSWNLKDIPLGDLSVDVDDLTEKELQAFEDWMLKIWYEKDELMDKFYKTGSFTDPTNKNEKTVVGKLQLRGTFEVLTIYIPLTIILVSLASLFYLIRLIFF
ncbi:acyltransferase-domain-containing protein [Scheffersomyces coipomensis]|uniref:acyltransferase-domain-containing protein n=1 Tax=Scheffersomyces coipomensis TaxID=1788519 RepID=UPI00315CC8B0